MSEFNEKEKKLLEYYTKLKEEYPNVYKKIGIAIIALVTIPVIIWISYFIGDCGFILINTSLTIGDALGFYGSFLAFIGTVSLGALALWQNKKANQTNETIMEMTRREKMAYFYPDGLNAISNRNAQINFKNIGNSFGTILKVQIKVNDKFKLLRVAEYLINNQQNKEFDFKLKDDDFKNNNLNVKFKFTWCNSFGFLYFQIINITYEKINECPLYSERFIMKNISTHFEEYEEETKNDLQ